MVAEPFSFDLCYPEKVGFRSPGKLVAPVPTYHGQFGEDRILAQIFGSRADGVCVEVGANNGRDGSATLLFEQRGWACVLVEPNPSLCEILRATRRGQVFECGASDREGIATLQLAEGDGLAHAVSTLETGADAQAALRRHCVASRPVEVRIRTLDGILSEAGVVLPDFVTIDVEGHELSVLRGFDVARWRPRILLLENNSEAQDREIVAHLAERGYVRFHRTGVNDWYARQSDRTLIRPGRAVRYRARAALAHAGMHLAPAKAALARVPGVLAAVRGIRRLTGSR